MFLFVINSSAKSAGSQRYFRDGFFPRVVLLFDKRGGFRNSLSFKKT